MIEHEQWSRTFASYDHEISNFGNIRHRVARGGSGITVRNDRGTAVISLPDELTNRRETYSLAMLVADAFMGYDYHTYTIHHKDGDGMNCHADNLQWVDSEGTLHELKGG